LHSKEVHAEPGCGSCDEANQNPHRTFGNLRGEECNDKILDYDFSRLAVLSKAMWVIVRESSIFAAL